MVDTDASKYELGTSAATVARIEGSRHQWIIQERVRDRSILVEEFNIRWEELI